MNYPMYSSMNPRTGKNWLEINEALPIAMGCELFNKLQGIDQIFKE